MKNKDALKEIYLLDDKIQELRWSINYHEPKLIWAKSEIERAFERKSQLEKIIIKNVSINNHQKG